MPTKPCVVCGRQSARFIFVDEEGNVEIQQIKDEQGLLPLGQRHGRINYSWVDDREGKATTDPRKTLVPFAMRAILPVHEDCEADMLLTGSVARLRDRSPSGRRASLVRAYAQGSRG